MYIYILILLQSATMTLIPFNTNWLDGNEYLDHVALRNLSKGNKAYIYFTASLLPVWPCSSSGRASVVQI